MSKYSIKTKPLTINGYEVDTLPGGFPIDYVPRHVKETPDYIAQYLNAAANQSINDEYGYYNDNKLRFEENRLYFESRQSKAKYLDLLNAGAGTESDGDGSWLNLNFDPVDFSKYIKVVVNRVIDTPYDPIITSVDEFSEAERKSLKTRARVELDNRNKMQEVRNNTGFNISKFDRFFEDEDDIRSYFDNFSLAHEAILENAVRNIVEEHNGYFDIKRKALIDQAVLGICAIKNETDPQGGIKLRYVDPEYFYTSYTEMNDFRDITWAFERRLMTIGEIDLEDNGLDLTIEDKIEIAKTASRKYGNGHFDQRNFDEKHLNEFRVEVIDGCFRSIDTELFEKKETQHGRYTFKEKELGHKPPKNSKYKRELVESSEENVYKGKLIYGTDYVFDYGLDRTSVKRTEADNLIRTRMPYKVYASQLNDMRTKSIWDTVIKHIDEATLVNLKIQQILLKQRPPGIAIELSAIETLDYGRGDTIDVTEVIDFYDATGNIIYRRNENDPFNQIPITEINNRVNGQLNDLVQLYHHHVRNIELVTGINDLSSGASPGERLSSKTGEQALQASSNVTKDIDVTLLRMTKEIYIDVTSRFQNILPYKDVYEGYSEIFGEFKTQKIVIDGEIKDRIIKSIPAIAINPGFTLQQKARFDEGLDVSVSEGRITSADKARIVNVRNPKTAYILLDLAEKRERRNRLEEAKMASQQAAEDSAMAAERAAQAKIQEQNELARIEIQKLMETRRIEEEYAKIEHDRNIEIELIKADAKITSESMKWTNKNLEQNKTRSNESITS